MSELTRFHTTEALLLEREQLHRLVDYFWKVLPHTRDEVYQMLATSLNVSEIHISDMTSEQIKQAAGYFLTKLSDLAPCKRCKNARQTTYGMILCNEPNGAAEYWCRPDNANRKCDYFVQRNISDKRSR